MTDLERAAQINASIRAQSLLSIQAEMLAGALRREREAEREACAKIVEKHARMDNPFAVTVCDLAAKAIRNRKD